MNFLEPITQQEQTSILAQYLRNDPLHASKNIEGNNLQKLLSGLALEFLRERDKVNEVYSEYDPNSTTKLLEEWETFVGIPDSCFTNTGTIEQRRKNILLKLVGSNATTAEQFEAIALVLGFTINVQAGGDVSVFPLQLPFILTPQADIPFVIVVTISSALFTNTFPLILPFILGSDQTEILKCFLEKLKPAHCVIQYRYL